MEVGTEGYSPRILEQIEYVGANAVSFKRGQEDMKKLASVEISDKHIRKLTERFGAEREQIRDAKVKAMKRDQLKPKALNRPTIAAVHLDAGKVQTRQEDEGGRGVRGEGWNDVKVGCFLSYQDNGGVHEEDPQPKVPKKRLDKPAVKRLCQEMANVRGMPQKGTRERAKKEQPNEQEIQRQAKSSHAPTRPERLVRTAVATVQKVEAFGWIVAAEARLRGFYEASRKAVVGDGGNWIWPLADLHFDGFRQVLDFLHLMSHLYAAAQAAYEKLKAPEKAWQLYTKLITKAWAGEVKSLISLLERHSKRIGKPTGKTPDKDPRTILAHSLEYVRNNQKRMDYPTYRREGLPISSAPVESLIKQFNQRIKGTEKFWHASRVEAVLQSRAAHLSEDRREREFWSKRKSLGRAVGQNRLRRTAEAVS